MSEIRSLIDLVQSKLAAKNLMEYYSEYSDKEARIDFEYWSEKYTKLSDEVDQAALELEKRLV